MTHFSVSTLINNCAGDACKKRNIPGVKLLKKVVLGMNDFSLNPGVTSARCSHFSYKNAQMIDRPCPNSFDTIMRNILMDSSGHAKSDVSYTNEQCIPVPNATTPYWRTELHSIDEYRSTDDLPSNCDIAIIGAGLAGVATAYHLSKSGSHSIVLLEARQVCSGATGRNGVRSRTVQTQKIEDY